MSQDLFAASCAVVAYGASAMIEIELPNGRRVSPTAAFGPALATLGSGGYGSVPSSWLLLSALAIEALILGFRRRPASTLIHSFGLLVSFGAIAWVARLRLGGHSHSAYRLLLGVAFASVAYFAFDLGWQALAPGRMVSRLRTLSEGARAGYPIAVVMASAAGLIVLVFPGLRWASFLVMFVPVLAARYEFARYGETRRTYDETVRALAGLAEGAGYVSHGHQARVADLCLRIGQELSISSTSLRELELVALLHDVGAVSLPDPADVEAVDQEFIARSSSRVLEETRYLAKWAPVVVAVAQNKPGLPVEARILRVADAYDQVTGTPLARIAALRRMSRENDAPILAALTSIVREG